MKDRVPRQLHFYWAQFALVLTTLLVLLFLMILVSVPV